jgi:hypothetical protein
MGTATPSLVDGTKDEQRRLADSLIETLGLDGAIYACRANAWDGVLDFVLSHRPSDGNSHH